MREATVGTQLAPGLYYEQSGAAAIMRLSRPEAQNVLTIEGRAQWAAHLPRFARNPLVYAVVIQSDVEGMFCAGADVGEIVALAERDMAAACQVLADESALVWLAECFTKPTVALINGPVLGAGNGISRFGTHRVAGEEYQFAMPETARGFFPTNGLAHTFARMPKDIGMYLALTGTALGPADAYHLGLVTHCIPASEFAAITAALSEADPVDPVLDSRHQDPGPAPLLARAEAITRTFGAGTVSEIIARLERLSGPDAAWAEATRGQLLARSPTALGVTHRFVREASALQLSEVLELEHAVACRLLEMPDFYVGARAGLSSSTGAPVWRPARTQEVSPAMLEAIFSPMQEGSLRLSSRKEMQQILA